jgi:hypothetical protein
MAITVTEAEQVLVAEMAQVTEQEVVLERAQEMEAVTAEATEVALVIR